MEYIGDVFYDYGGGLYVNMTNRRLAGARSVSAIWWILWVTRTASG